MISRQTSQPSLPWERDGKWYYTYYTLAGPEERGPFTDRETAREQSSIAVRIHEANGYTDGDVTAVID
jgi:hypothetical protein